MTTNSKFWLGFFLTFLPSLAFAIGNTSRTGLDVKNVNGSGTLNFNSTGTITVPNATDTLVGKATTDTLTNKTFTAPVLGAATGTSLTLSGQMIAGNGNGQALPLVVGLNGSGTTTVASNHACMDSRDSAEGDDWLVGNNCTGSQAKGDFQITDSSQSPTPRLYITSSTGRVGINNATPASTLDVSGSFQVSGVSALTGIATFTAAPVFSSGTASTVPYLDASKVLTSSAATPTQLGFLANATSNLCGINQSCTITGTKTGGTYSGITLSGTTTFPNSGSVDSSSQIRMLRMGLGAAISASYDLTIQGTTSTVAGVNVASSLAGASSGIERGVEVNNTLDGGNVLSSYSGLHVNDPALVNSTTATTVYGLRLDNITAGGTNYEILAGTAQSRFNGKLGVKMDPSNDLDVTGTFGVTGVGSFTASLGVGTASPAGFTEYAATPILAVSSASYGSTVLNTTAADGSGTRMGAISFEQSTNTATFRSRAVIEALSSGSTANKRGGKIVLRTAADNATTPAIALTIDQDLSATFAGVIKFANLLLSPTAPTISSGFGSSPSISGNNGTGAFEVNVGTGGSATSGVIGLTTAATGWNCYCTDITTNSSTVFMCKQTASSTTTATVGNFNTSAAAAAWVASDKLRVSCHAY